MLKGLAPRETDPPNPLSWMPVVMPARCGRAANRHATRLRWHSVTRNPCHIAARLDAHHPSASHIMERVAMSECRVGPVRRAEVQRFLDAVSIVLATHIKPAQLPAARR